MGWRHVYAGEVELRRGCPLFGSMELWHVLGILRGSTEKLAQVCCAYLGLISPQNSRKGVRGVLLPEAGGYFYRAVSVGELGRRNRHECSQTAAR